VAAITQLAEGQRAYFISVPIPSSLEVVESLNRPGRNFTGVTLLSAELAPKRLELMHELVPSAQTFALLINPDNWGTARIIETPG
jgi:ABC-type uncharacterized transport system substrate-binding protein